MNYRDYTLRPLCLCLFLVLSASGFAQTRYTITNLGNLGGTNLFPYAINATGAIVGSEVVTVQQATQPFLYSGGVMTRLPSLGSGTDLNDAKGINAAGTIVGTSLFVATSAQRGWIISGGVLTDLGADTYAGAINDAGTVAGYSGTTAFVQSGGVRTPIGNLGGPIFAVTAINAAGAVAGTSETATGGLRRAFRYSGGVMTNLGALGSTGRNSYAYGINAAGVVVGQANEATNTQLHAFVYSGGVMIDIDPPGTNSPVFGSAGYGINSAGTVVGTYAADRAFVYTSAGGLVDLNNVNVVINLAASGFTLLREAYAINDAGQIIGRGSLSNGRFGAFRLDISTIPDAPTIIAGPQTHVVPPGTNVVFTVLASSTGLTYQWRLNNTAIPGATGTSYSIASAGAANAGSYSVVVTNEGGTVTSAPGTLTVTNGTAGRLINLSILTPIAAGGDNFSMGYVVGGSSPANPKPLVIRAAGHSLGAPPLNYPGVLEDPKIELFAGTTATVANDNWGGSPAIAAAMLAVGAFPFTDAASRDAALVPNISQSDNSVRVSAAGAGSGAVLAEVYDATPTGNFTAATPRLVNLSVSKNISGGLTMGFVVGGSASRTVLVRAVGPSLLQFFGVPDAVADPQFALFAGTNKIGENNDWGGSAALAAVFKQVGAFELPATSKDAALLITLAPGDYSVQVTGVGNTSGTALAEVYEVP